QLVERLNRTYKFHTRPRAGFKNFDGAVALTTLFVAYYNFMRPHGRLNDEVPVELSCLKGKTLYPAMWVEMLRQAA
ncbi:MAG: transposase, partial [Verrucomicrobia bacterium]|nr:transposase [Verrucomicrobiota bacterium]